MRNVIVLAALFFLLFSCNKTEKTNGQVEVVQLTEESLPPVQPLKLEKVELSEDYTMGRAICIIYQDTILIVLKDGDPYPFTHMLTLVNMNNDEKIGEYFTRGQGPNELLSAIPRLSYNVLDILCYTTGRVVSFDLDSAIIHGNDYKPNIIYTNNNFVDWCSMDDTLVLTSNSYHFDHNEEFKDNARIPEFYWYSKSGKTTPEYKESDYRNIEAFASDVSGSTISINKVKNRVVCCYFHQPYIKVFDLDMNLTKKVSGPEIDDGKYILMDGYRIYFDPNEGRRDYYYYATCNEDNIFVTNKRFHKKKQVEPEIFKLDWDGNVVGRYSANGKNIGCYNYSKNSNTLYLLIIEDGEYYVYKAKLD